MNTPLRLTVGFLVASLAACGDDGASRITLSTAVPDSESGDIIITAQRMGSSSGEISIQFTTIDDSAVETSDYVATTGSIRWEDGDTESKTIAVPIVDDLIIEPSETMVIELDPSDGAELDETSVVATIVDDDGPGNSFGVTSAGRLVHFNSSQPGRLSWAVELTGFGSEKVLGVDMRPADGKLYAITGAAKLYTIDPMTGAATAKATLVADPTDGTNPFTGLSGTELGFDFNPLDDRLRIVTSTGQNLKINVDTGEVTTETAINGSSTGYTAAAFNNNVAPACRSTLYAIDVSNNRVLSQSPPNTGTTLGVGGLGVDATASGGFDVVTTADGKSVGIAFLTVAGVMGGYTIDLGAGDAVLVKPVGPLPPDETVVSFAVSTLPPTTPVTQREGDFFGVTATDVISFNREATAKFCTNKTINGLAAGEVIVGGEVRPSTGVFYILTKINTAGKLHRVDATSGTISPAIPISVPLQGTDFGLDFNPTGTVPLRIVSNTGQNIRVTDLTTGAAVADTALNGAGSTATGAAYTDSVPGAGTTTLYVIDAATDRLRIQNPPNSGTLVDVGPLGVDIADASGFDIDGRDNTAMLVVTVGASSQLHTINLATGALSASFSTIAGAPLRGFGRATPQTNVYGITTENKLVRINLNDPSMVTVVSDPMLMPPVETITGLAPNEHLVGIDVRPADRIIYGVGNLGGLYTVNSATARANNQGKLAADPMDTSSPFTVMSGASFGVDFDPTGTGPLRIVSTNEQNLRITNLMMPRVFTDALLQPPGGPVDAIASAYTNSFVVPAGVPAPSTTLYVIDGISGQLMIQSPPNSGALSVVGSLAASGSFYDPAMPTHSGFDIAAGNNGVALAAFQRPGEAFSRLYRIDLATGAATEIGNRIGGAPLRGLAIQIR